MYKVIEERHGRYVEVWETVGHWAERPDGSTFWYVEQYVQLLKVKAA